MTLVKKRTVMGAKHEATVGTKETLAVADLSFNAYNFSIEPNLDFEEREAMGSFGTRRSTPSGPKGTASFRIDLQANGDDIPTWASVLFPACGLVLDGTTFKPVSRVPGGATGVQTVTISKWMDGKKRTLYGAMGTFTITLPTSRIGYIDFEFEGLFDAEIDEALPVPTYPNDALLTCRGGPTTFAGQPLCVESATFTLGNTLYVKECQNKALGFEFAIVTQRKPTITANPESKLVAQDNRMNRFLNGLEDVFRYVVPCPGYNATGDVKSIIITAPKAQYSEYTEGDRSGVAIDELTWALNQDPATPDSDFSIQFNTP